MTRPYEWHAAGDTLHAIPNTEHAPFPPLPGDVVSLLCGGSAVLEREDFRRRQLRPCCSTCNSRWRAEQDQAAAAARTRTAQAVAGTRRR